MTKQVLLIGGCKNGHRIETDVSRDYVAFYKKRDVLPFHLMDKNEPPMCERETYTILPIRGERREWWIGIADGMTLDDALEMIIGRYP